MVDNKKRICPICGNEYNKVVTSPLGFRMYVHSATVYKGKILTWSEFEGCQEFQKKEDGD